MTDPPAVAYRGTCSLCGGELNVGVGEWHRELACCAGCGLNARLRGIVLALSMEVYGSMTVPLADRPARRDISILGISDSAAYSRLLSERFSYVNTQYHQEPRLDICDRAACQHYAGHDIVICSDVIEHTLQGPLLVTSNLMAMLRPNGALILTAPTFDMDESIEWYGALADYRVEQQDGRYRLRWKNLRGQEFLDEEPIFHGGPGAVAELRLLSHRQLLSIGKQLGAVMQTIEFRPDWGYSWPMVPQFPYLKAPVDGRVIVYRAPRPV